MEIDPDQASGSVGRYAIQQGPATQMKNEWTMRGEYFVTHK